MTDDAEQWEAMAQEGRRKLDQLRAEDTGTDRERFNIEHQELYVACCLRFAREPELADLTAWRAVADQFVRQGGELAKRYGIKL